MRKKFVYIISAMVLGCPGLPAWSQQLPPDPVPVPGPEISLLPQVQPFPVPTPLGQPQPIESPPPEPASSGVVPGMGAADPSSPHGYWSTGGGAYFIQPVFSSNPAFISVTSNAPGRTFNPQQ